MMISSTSLKRKSTNSSSSLDSHLQTNTNSHSSLSSTKKFRGVAYDGNINQHEQRMSLLSNSNKLITSTKKLNMINGETMKPYKRFEESECTPVMLAEYRRLQHELQCQEALLVLMQKLKTNQKLISSSNNNSVKQKPTATKLNQQNTLTDGKTTPITATKQQQSSTVNNANRVASSKPGHPNQYTVNRPSVNSSTVGNSSKNSVPPVQATRQSNSSSNNAFGTTSSATRLSSTPTALTTSSKTSSALSTTSNSSKSNGIASEQHLLNAKLALRKQLEQTLLQIPTPKPSTCDLTFIPSVNGWSEFLTYIGLEQAFNIYNDIVNRRPPSEMSPNMPHVCASCGTDWSVTWHEVTSPNNENNTTEEKILCDRCTKSSQKKLLKQDHSNRLRQAFIKALQQEKELDAKFQQQSSSSSSSSTTTSTTNVTSGSTTTSSTAPTSSSIKQSPSSSSISSQNSTKHVQSSSKHSNKPLSTKTSSNHHHHHHHHHNSSSSNNHNHHSHSHSHHHHHHHGSKSSSSSSSSKSHLNNSASALAGLGLSPAETLASTLAALHSNEQMELFQKHFLSNVLPFALANPTTAAAFAAKPNQQQQQQQAMAAFPAMANLMRQQNPAQYLLDMIPQAAKQQQQHHHHSK